MLYSYFTRLIAGAVAVTVGETLKACGKEKLGHEVMKWGGPIGIEHSRRTKQLTPDEEKALSIHDIRKGDVSCRRCGRMVICIKEAPAPCIDQE